MDSQAIKSPVRRISEFEGLRGLLAWWVVIFHLYQHARVDPGAIPRILEVWAGSGWVAVEVFIILSGFVIALLIETQREDYGKFITRRFFRLAPVYYVLVAYGVVEALVLGEYGDQLWKHVVLHLTILHGLVPDELLPGSAISLCHPAWSISVEWQFYLIAPFVLAAVRSSATRALGVLVGCLFVSYLLQHHYSFPFHATVVMRAGLFGVGIASYYFYRIATTHRDLIRPFARFLLPVGIASAWVFQATLFSTGTLWVLIFSSVLAAHVGAETPVTRPLRRFLDLPVILWLGKVSYSTYLCHNVGLILVTRCLGETFTRLSAWGRLLTLFGLGAPVILALSAALYYLIEQPGIQLGRVVSSRMTRVAPATDVEPLVPAEAI